MSLAEPKSTLVALNSLKKQPLKPLLTNIHVTEKESSSNNVLKKEENQTVKGSESNENVEQNGDTKKSTLHREETERVEKKSHTEGERKKSKTKTKAIILAGQKFGFQASSNEDEKYVEDKSELTDKKKIYSETKESH